MATSIRQVILLTLLALALSASLAPRQTNAAFISREMQVRVTMRGSASSAYASQLYVSGWNQNGTPTSHTWTQSPWTYHQIEAPNWWWKVDPDHGVVVRFYLDGYGWRSCDQTMKLSTYPPYGGSWVTIYYDGATANPHCVIYTF